jgi:hypothetical protein
MKEIIETFFKAVLAIQPDSIAWPNAIANLLEELQQQYEAGKPKALKHLDSAKFAGNAAYQKAVEALQIAWSALLTTTPQVRSVSSSSTSNSTPQVSFIPPSSTANSTFTSSNQPVTTSVATKNETVVSNSNSVIVQSTAIGVPNPSSLIQNRLKELNASATKPIPKQVTDIQGKSLEDRFRDAAKLIKVDQDFLACLKGKSLLTPSGTAPNIDSIRTLIDPLLKTGRVVNELDKEQVSSLENARANAAAIQIVLKYYGLDKISDSKHWIAKGKLLHANSSVPFVCDGSAAIAFYILYTAPSVGCHLAIVEQGQGNANGHWYVMAYKDNASVTAKDGMCVVDLWGANFMNLKSAVQSQPFVTLSDDEKKNKAQITCWL